MRYQKLFFKYIFAINILLSSIPALSQSTMSISLNGYTRNVLGTKLQTCCTDPMTGFYRDGNCETGPEDLGTHVVCAEMTQEFLEFTRSRGNDLSTPIPLYRFPGLKPGDKWCLCALRWKEAFDAGVAPPVVLERTHEKALEFIQLEDLKAHELQE